SSARHRLSCARRRHAPADAARTRRRRANGKSARGTLHDVACCGVEAHQGAGEGRVDPPRGARPHAFLPPRAGAARQRPRVAKLLRALLDGPHRCARAASPRGGRPQIPRSPEKRRQAMTPDAYGVLTEPATLKIQRLLPGPIERVWAYLTKGE